MKVVIIADKKRYEKFMPEGVKDKGYIIKYFPLNTPNEEILKEDADADVVVADAIAKVDAELINAMPNLKLIHSEGVAFDKIDIDTAKNHGIHVCNNRGANAFSVAEQTVLLMLSLLRDVVNGHLGELAGRQIELKQAMMLNGYRELGECTVGLIGFGDIAKATAKLLSGFGCRVCYYNRNRRDLKTEEEYNVTYMEMDELLKCADFVSIHVPVTKETTSMVNEDFINKMKPDAFLINTARGEMVDNGALREALIKGRIAGAAFDTIAPEPTPADHPLVALPSDIKSRVIYSPHIGGVSTGTFKRCHARIWRNIENLEKGKDPENVLN